MAVFRISEKYQLENRNFKKYIFQNILTLLSSTFLLLRPFLSDSCFVGRLRCAIWQNGTNLIIFKKRKCPESKTFVSLFKLLCSAPLMFHYRMFFNDQQITRSSTSTMCLSRCMFQSAMDVIRKSELKDIKNLVDKDSATELKNRKLSVDNDDSVETIRLANMDSELAGLFILGILMF